LSAHVESSQILFQQRKRFLNLDEATKTPFIIGIAGSVAVGKSTTARILRELLRRWPSSPRVAHVTTDGFLFPNEILREKGLMDRKGFPESYDVNALMNFLGAIKAGRSEARAPFYSHLVYDVVPNEFITIDRPDILIFEGINVLQPRQLPKDGKVVPFVSDYFDFAIYIDADEKLIHKWYVERFMKLRETAFRDPKSFFHRYTALTEDAALSDCRKSLDQHQYEKPGREHFADAAPRRSDPDQGSGPSGQGSVAEKTLGWLAYPPQSQVDPATVLQECRRCRVNPVHAMKRQSALPADQDNVAALQPE
jgi:pantothenate kinase